MHGTLATLFSERVFKPLVKAFLWTTWWPANTAKWCPSLRVAISGLPVLLWIPTALAEHKTNRIYSIATRNTSWILAACEACMPSYGFWESRKVSILMESSNTRSALDLVGSILFGLEKKLFLLESICHTLSSPTSHTKLSPNSAFPVLTNS